MDSATRSETERTLRRLLANGPLTGLPSRRDDVELLLQLAAARFESGRAYGEKDVNQALRQWLATFSEPYGIDHVSLRRELVDARLLVRDTSGSEYRLNPRRMRRDVAEAAPADVLAEIREERAARKRQHAS
jgi:hypothetical protein